MSSYVTERPLITSFFLFVAVSARIIRQEEAEINVSKMSWWLKIDFLISVLISLFCGNLAPSLTFRAEELLEESSPPSAPVSANQIHRLTDAFRASETTLGSVRGSLTDPRVQEILILSAAGRS